MLSVYQNLQHQGVTAFKPSAQSTLHPAITDSTLDHIPLIHNAVFAFTGNFGTAYPSDFPIDPRCFLATDQFSARVTRTAVAMPEAPRTAGQSGGRKTFIDEMVVVVYPGNQTSHTAVHELNQTMNTNTNKVFTFRRVIAPQLASVTAPYTKAASPWYRTSHTAAAFVPAMRVVSSKNTFCIDPDLSDLHYFARHQEANDYVLAKAPRGGVTLLQFADSTTTSAPVFTSPDFTLVWSKMFIPTIGGSFRVIMDYAPGANRVILTGIRHLNT